VAAKPAAPATPVVKAATEAPQPSDWRESWGKIEPWKSASQADAAKPTDKPADKPMDKPAEKPARRVTKAPAKLDPPKQPDPLKDPAWYGEVALKQKPANSKIPEEKPESETPSGPEKTAVAQKNTPNPLPPVPPPQNAVAPVSATAAQPTPQTTASATPPMPQMTAAPAPVAASVTTPTGRVIEVPADEPNAFEPEKPPSSEAGAAQQSKFNAFDRGENNPPSRGIIPAGIGASQGPPRMGGPAMGPMAMARPPMGPMPMPMPPRPPMPPPMVDSGVPDNMGNAFTLTGTRRPIPADFGGTPQEPNGFGDAVPQMTGGQGSPPRAYPVASSGMMPPRRVNPYTNAAAASGAPAMAAKPTGDVSQLLATLKESMYPSQREWAAEQLSELNWRKQPHVVESLTKSARDDQAATVRVACVRALGHMKANSDEVVALVRDLKNDRDPRVRREADEVLTAFNVAPRQDSVVQQASHK
jgi:hypothetical protein